MHLKLSCTHDAPYRLEAVSTLLRAPQTLCRLHGCHAHYSQFQRFSELLKLESEEELVNKPWFQPFSVHLKLEPFNSIDWNASLFQPSKCSSNQMVGYQALTTVTARFNPSQSSSNELVIFLRTDQFHGVSTLLRAPQTTPRRLWEASE